MVSSSTPRRRLKNMPLQDVRAAGARRNSLRLRPGPEDGLAFPRSSSSSSSASSKELGTFFEGSSAAEGSAPSPSCSMLSSHHGPPASPSPTSSHLLHIPGPDELLARLRLQRISAAFRTRLRPAPPAKRPRPAQDGDAPEQTTSLSLLAVLATLPIVLCVFIIGADVRRRHPWYVSAPISLSFNETWWSWLLALFCFNLSGIVGLLGVAPVLAERLLRTGRLGGARGVSPNSATKSIDLVAVGEFGERETSVVVRTMLRYAMSWFVWFFATAYAVVGAVRVVFWAYFRVLNSVEIVENVNDKLLGFEVAIVTKNARTKNTTSDADGTGRSEAEEQEDLHVGQQQLKTDRIGGRKGTKTNDEPASAMIVPAELLCSYEYNDKTGKMVLDRKKLFSRHDERFLVTQLGDFSGFPLALVSTFFLALYLAFSFPSLLPLCIFLPEIFVSVGEWWSSSWSTSSQKTDDHVVENRDSAPGRVEQVVPATQPLLRSLRLYANDLIYISLLHHKSNLINLLTSALVMTNLGMMFQVCCPVQKNRLLGTAWPETEWQTILHRVGTTPLFFGGYVHIVLWNWLYMVLDVGAEGAVIVPRRWRWARLSCLGLNLLTGVYVVVLRSYYLWTTYLASLYYEGTWEDWGPDKYTFLNRMGVAQYMSATAFVAFILMHGWDPVLQRTRRGDGGSSVCASGQ